MAFVSNYTPEDEQQKPAAQGAVPPVGSGSVQLAPSGGIGSVGGPAQPGAPQGGGQFATLDKYLAANQGQAEPLANKITSDIGNQYNTLQSQNQSTLSNVRGQVANAPGYTASNPDILSQEAANPTTFAANQGNVQQFQGLLNNSYGGPLTAESTPEYTKQQAAVNNAIASGQQQTGTEAGREQLLQKHEAAPSASVTGLNTAILSQSPTALNRVENAYKPFSSLLSGLQSGAQDINQQIAKQQADATQSSAQANKQIAQQTKDFQTAMQDKLNAAQNQYNQYNQGLQNYSTTMSGVQANVAPLEAALGSNFAPNYTFPTYDTLTTAPTSNSVATPDQLAFQNVLNQLSGQNLSVINPKESVNTFTPPAAIPNVSATLQQFANPLLSAVQKKAASLAPLATTNPAAYTQQYQGLMNILSNASKYLNQYDPTNYHAVAGTPNSYYVYPT